MVGLALAGWAGGVIAAHMPHSPDFKDFEKKPIGFWGAPIMSYRGTREKLGV